MLETYKKYICSNCKGNCDKGIVIIKTRDATESYCPDYKPDREKIKEKAYKDNKVNITAKKSKALMNLNI